MDLVVTALACAALNRARGDDRWMPDWLPGRALYYTAPLIGAIAAILGGISFGAASGAAFFVWAVGPWGHSAMEPYSGCGCVNTGVREFPTGLGQRWECHRRPRPGDGAQICSCSP